jgi:zinc protease
MSHSSFIRPSSCLRRKVLVALTVSAFVVGAFLQPLPVLAEAQLTGSTAGLAGSLLDNVPDAIFNPETFTLDNGLQVVVIPNHRAPVVTHMVWYKVGAADDPRNKHGLAHFLEHLMFKGTDKVGPGEFSAVIASLGGEENAFTSYEYTAYFQTVAREDLETMMRMEADRMTGLTLAPEIVRAERDVIAEERRQVVDSRPHSKLGEAMDALLYAGSPYAIPVIGWAEDIQNLEQQDVEDFYHRWYAPNNAILVVSGDITAKELKPLAEKYYGPQKANQNLPARVRPHQAPIEVAARIVMHDPQIERPYFNRSIPAPENTLGTEPEAYALSVLIDIMSGGTASRIYQSLVVKQRLANNVGMASGSGRISASEITVYGEPAEGHSVDDLAAGFDAEIAKLIKDGVTEKEVQEAKERLLAQAIFVRDSVSMPARIFGSSLATGETVEDVEQWAARIAAVPVGMVNAVARDIFESKFSVTGILLPVEPAPGAPEVSQ